MSRRSLPPLNALRAFEAAARHGSFTKAANELCVTPGAVSRQVQVLEEHLGTPLFHAHEPGGRPVPSRASATERRFRRPLTKSTPRQAP